jgi:hypothetical protein
MRPSRSFALGAISSGIALSVAFLAVPSLGGSGSPKTQFATQHRLHVKGEVTAAARRKPSGIRNILVLEDKGTAPPGKEDGFRYKCPAKAPYAVSGYFLPEKPEQAGQVQLADSFPSGKKNSHWDIGVFNPTPTPQPYFVGVVCIK